MAQNKKKKTMKKRVSSGQRFDADLVERIKIIAEKQRSSPRAVWEQLAERGLPDLEKFYNVNPAPELPPGE
jgi:hypothetical protein